MHKDRMAPKEIDKGAYKRSLKQYLGQRLGLSRTER